MLFLRVDDNPFGLQFTRQRFSCWYYVYSENLAVPVEDVSYVGGYYHRSNLSFNLFSVLIAALPATSNPLDSTNEA